MSQGDGHFSVSGTKIEGEGYTKQNVLIFALHGLVYTHPSMAAYLPCLPGSPCISAGVLTSFVPPVHNQGVSSFTGSCSMENIPADYRLILCYKSY